MKKTMYNFQIKAKGHAWEDTPPIHKDFIDQKQAVDYAKHLSTLYQCEIRMTDNPGLNCGKYFNTSSDDDSINAFQLQHVLNFFNHAPGDFFTDETMQLDPWQIDHLNRETKAIMKRENADQFNAGIMAKLLSKFDYDLLWKVADLINQQKT